MSSKLIVGIIFFCLILSAIVSANMFLIMMIGEINRKREGNHLISYFGFTFSKMLRIFREYRRLYPEGKLHIYSLFSFVAAMIGLLAMGVCLQII